MQQRRFDLDLLKCIAIFAVVLYHANFIFETVEINFLHYFSSGFLGVDIFFVVSGFLTASSVIRNLNKQQFSLKQFFLRRLLRIYPTLLVLCTICILVGYFLLFSREFSELVVEAANALVFIGNIRLSNASSYFDLDVSQKLLLHTWYLCITVQFYVLYPIILLVLKKIFGLERLLTVNLLLVVPFIILAIYTSKDGTGYLTTSSRIWELFLGASIYSLQDRLNKKLFSNHLVKIICSVLGFCLVILPFAVIDLSYGSWYISTSILTVIGSILVILATFNCTLFNNSFIKFVSSSTLSIYLWHYPLMIFMIKMKIVDSSLFFIYAVLIVSVFSVLSYKVIESLSFDTFKIAKTSALIGCFLICLFGYLNFKSENCKTYLNQFLREGSNNNLNANWNNVKQLNLGNDVIVKTVSIKNNEFPTTFLIGDSHTAQLESYLSNSKEPLVYYCVSATMAYGKYFANVKNVIYPKLKYRLPIFYNTYKTVLQKLKDDSNVIITSHFLAYYGEYLKENKLNRNAEGLNLYVHTVIKDLDEQISLYPNLNFFICTDGISVPLSYVEQSKLDLRDSFLKHILRTGITTSIDISAYENEIILNQFNEYAKTKNNVIIINRLNTFKSNQKKKLYDIVSNDINLFFDGNHQSPYGAEILGKFIFDSVKANEYTINR